MWSETKITMMTGAWRGKSKSPGGLVRALFEQGVKGGGAAYPRLFCFQDEPVVDIVGVVCAIARGFAIAAAEDVNGNTNGRMDGRRL